jgi:hypothetical protein
MDAMGIFWMVLYSTIAIITGIKLMKLRATSSSSSASKEARNQYGDNSSESESINGAAESQEGLCDCIALTKRACDKGRDSSNEKAGDRNPKDSFQHSDSITAEDRGSQSQKSRE